MEGRIERREVLGGAINEYRRACGCRKLGREADLGFSVSVPAGMIASVALRLVYLIFVRLKDGWCYWVARRGRRTR
jgi:hypothetical protein